MQESSKTSEFDSVGTILVIEQLYKSYQLGAVEPPVLRAIDLTIKSGKYVALRGPTGPGKSTLVNMIGCLDRPSSGAKGCPKSGRQRYLVGL